MCINLSYILEGLECNLFIKQNEQNWMYAEALAGTA
jgi:hypothetical protein